MRGTILSLCRNLLGRLLFPSPAHQLLQLAFDRRVVDALQKSRAATYHGCRRFRRDF
jgi:hypothetical protein